MLYSTISFLARSLNGEESLKNFEDPDPDLHQNLISLALSQTQPVHKLSSGSVHNFLRYPVHRQTERGENITSFTFGGRGNNHKGTADGVQCRECAEHIVKRLLCLSRIEEFPHILQETQDRTHTGRSRLLEVG